MPKHEITLEMLKEKGLSLTDALCAVQADICNEALQSTNHNIAAAARLLGMHRTTLQMRMNKTGQVVPNKRLHPPKPLE